MLAFIFLVQMHIGLVGRFYLCVENLTDLCDLLMGIDVH